MTGQTILIISPEAWGVNFVSKHHYAFLLAEAGNSVYFMAPPKSRFFSQAVRTTKIKNRLIVLEYYVLPGINRLPAKIRYWFQGFAARGILNKINAKVDIVWSFDPFVFQDLRLFKATKKIFHMADVHATGLLIEAARNADLVVTTSSAFEKYLRNRGVLAHSIGHGLARWFMGPSSTATKPERIHASRIRVGYVGNLHHRFIDSGSLIQAIVENPDFDFYFAGPVDVSNLGDCVPNQNLLKSMSDQPNVYLKGQIPSESIPEFMNDCDVLLLAHDNINYRVEASNPHKILEYLSSGKVVVTNPIDEYEDSNLVVSVKQGETLSHTLRLTVLELGRHTEDSQIRTRIEFARQHSYANQIAKVERLLELKLCFEISRQ